MVSQASSVLHDNTDNVQLVSRGVESGEVFVDGREIKDHPPALIVSALLLQRRLEGV